VSKTHYQKLSLVSTDKPVEKELTAQVGIFLDGEVYSLIKNQDLSLCSTIITAMDNRGASEENIVRELASSLKIEPEEATAIYRMFASIWLFLGA